MPELLYISFFTTYTGGADASAITAGVMLFRGFQWLYPIPLAWILLGHLAARQAAPADQGGVPGRRPATGAGRSLTGSRGEVGSDQPPTDVSALARTSPNS